MPAHTRHWPRVKGGLDCLCGWRAATPDRLYAHMFEWFYPMRRVEFRNGYRTRAGFRYAISVPGHRMTIRPSAVTGRDAIHCACGAVLPVSVAMGRGSNDAMEAVARRHVRELVYERCYGRKVPT